MMNISVVLGSLLLISVSCGPSDTAKEKAAPVKSYSFEGSEPFWSLELTGDMVNLFINEEYAGTVRYSNNASRGETFGFQNEKIAGIVNKTWNGYCEYAVTEKDSLNLEVMFIFDGKTYKGCGEQLNQ